MPCSRQEDEIIFHSLADLWAGRFPGEPDEGRHRNLPPTAAREVFFSFLGKTKVPQT